MAVCKLQIGCGTPYIAIPTDVHGLEANAGLAQFLEWADAQGFKKAAVTNAPRCVSACDLLVVGIEYMLLSTS